MKTALQTELDTNIPAEAVESREAWRGGPKLSYLTGAYVINRLNQILGQGNWGYTIGLTRVFEGTIEQSKGTAFTTSYIATVAFNAVIDGRVANFTEVGYGDGTDMKSAGKAHELATKEAVTDGLKRAAKNLGISLGLGLYFKSQEFVDEAVTEAPSRTKVQKPSAGVATIESATVMSEKPGTGGIRTPVSLKTTRQIIKQAFAVLQAQKKVTKDQFVADFTGGTKVDLLTDAAASATIEKIKTAYPELGL